MPYQTGVTACRCGLQRHECGFERSLRRASALGDTLAAYDRAVRDVAASRSNADHDLLF
jgi:hypothetical protein